jgi:hypothetical protein
LRVEKRAWFPKLNDFLKGGDSRKLKVWSKGLGTQSLNLVFSKSKLRAKDEALETMPKIARDKIQEGGLPKCIALTGTIETVNWNYVILITKKDIFSLLKRIISRKGISLFF